MWRWLRIIIFSCISVIVSLHDVCLSADYDINFGNRGIAIAKFGRYSIPLDAAILSDDSVLLVGCTGRRDPPRYCSRGSSIAVAKLSADGLLDHSFGFSGTDAIFSGSTSVAHQLVEMPNHDVILAATGLPPMYKNYFVRLGLKGRAPINSAPFSFWQSDFIVRDMFLTKTGDISLFASSEEVGEFIVFANLPGTNAPSLRIVQKTPLSLSSWVKGKAILDDGGGGYFLVGTKIAAREHLHKGQIGVARFTQFGDPVTTFGDYGLQLFGAADNTSYVKSMGSITHNGRIFVLGSLIREECGEGFRQVDAVVLAISEKGVLDASFGVRGYSEIDLGGCNSQRVIDIEMVGDWLYVLTDDLAGDCDYKIWRLSSDGELDSDFQLFKPFPAPEGCFHALGMLRQQKSLIVFGSVSDDYYTKEDSKMFVAKWLID